MTQGQLSQTPDSLMFPISVLKCGNISILHFRWEFIVALSPRGEASLRVLWPCSAVGPREPASQTHALCACQQVDNSKRLISSPVLGRVLSQAWENRCQLNLLGNTADKHGSLLKSFCICLPDLIEENLQVSKGAQLCRYFDFRPLASRIVRQ